MLRSLYLAVNSLRILRTLAEARELARTSSRRYGDSGAKRTTSPPSRRFGR